MFKNTSGFTIVELLVVIVVIGILAAIGTTAYAGMQRRADNTVRVTELRNWEKTLHIYRATYGQFPQNPSTANAYCLGSGFPEGGMCGDIYYTPNAYRENSTLMADIKKAGNLPTTSRYKLVNGAVGPVIFFEYMDNPISLMAVLNLPDNEQCRDHSLLEMYRNKDSGTAFCYVGLAE